MIIIHATITISCCITGTIGCGPRGGVAIATAVVGCIITVSMVMVTMVMVAMVMVMMMMTTVTIRRMLGT